MKAFKIIIIILLALVLCVAAYVWFFRTESLCDYVESIADASLEAGNGEKAAKYYDLAIKINDHDESVYLRRAEMYRAAGSYTQAEASLDEALALMPGVYDYYAALSAIFVEQDKLRDAAALLDGASDEAVAAALDAARPAAVQFSPEGGEYDKKISISMFAPGGCAIYYSMDEEYPSTRSGLYTAALSADDGELAVSALAVSENGLVSRLSTVQYSVSNIIYEVEFKDLTLEKLVRAALGKDEAEPVWTDELWELTELSCLDENGESLGPILRLDDLVHFTSLERLNLSGQTSLDLTQLSPVSKTLERLTLKGCEITTQQLEALAGLEKLVSLDLSDNRVAGVTHLAPVTTLEWLDLSDNSLSDIGGLASLRSLQYLDIGNNAVSDLTPLAGMTKLEELRCHALLVSDLTPLSGCASLRYLDLRYCAVSDFSPLASCARLKTLIADSNGLSDISTLSGCASLTALSLSRNEITDISPLCALASLASLDLSGNAIAALPGDMSGMSALEELLLPNNAISDVTPLAALGSLRSLDIEYCPVSDVSPLASCGALESLKAFGTGITNQGGLDSLGVTVYWDAAGAQIQTPENDTEPENTP